MRRIVEDICFIVVIFVIDFALIVGFCLFTGIVLN